jgi:hypothetical protein
MRIGMKAIVVLLVLISSSAFGESKYDLAREYLNINGDLENSMANLEKSLADNRKSFFELIEPFDIESEYIPQDVIAMREQLNIELEKSNIFKLNIKELEDVLIGGLVNALTHKELEQLVEIHKKPIFKKLSYIGQRMEAGIKDYMLDWQSKNELLVKDFQKKSKELSDLEMEYLKNAKED